MATEAVEKALERPPLKPRPALTLVGSPRVLSSDNYDCFIGVSVNVAALKQFISVQAMAHTPTLIISERGLRQEQVARALHNASENAAQPFFAVNAHSLDSDALHNLLFGTRGMIETCGRGTIYVNELTRLPALLQQRRQSRQFVDIDRASPAGFDHPASPEQEVVQRVAVQTVRVDGEKGLRRVLARVVQRPRDLLLPQSSLADDQRRSVRHRLHADELLERGDVHAHANKTIVIVRRQHARRTDQG